MSMRQIPVEMIVGLSTFVLGYLAHIRSVRELKIERHNEYEDNRIRFQELELEHLNKKQEAVESYLMRSIEHLEKERDYLSAKVDRLQDEILTLTSELSKYKVTNTID